MQRKIIFMLLSFSFAVLVINGCRDEEFDFPNFHWSENERGVQNQEYEVLSVILDSLYQNQESGVIYVADSTWASGITQSTSEAADQRIEYMQEKMPDASFSTLQDFKSKNLKSYRIHNMFNTKLRCELADRSKIYGKVTLSRVGFNRNNTQAFAYAGVLYAPLAGSGSYYILTYSRGRWKITGTLMAWIS
jgi:hypothetical protein